LRNPVNHQNWIAATSENYMPARGSYLEPFDPEDQNIVSSTGKRVCPVWYNLRFVVCTTFNDAMQDRSIVGRMWAVTQTSCTLNIDVAGPTAGRLYTEKIMFRDMMGHPELIPEEDNLITLYTRAIPGVDPPPP
jgi:hypothetical protein